MKPLPQKYAMGSDGLAGQVRCDLLDSHLVRVYTPRPQLSDMCSGCIGVLGFGGQTRFGTVQNA